ncbi:hypothetical protein Goshw_027386 [Gossypium schwendimanii]|uniref:Uncharacterized protein n=1 Tax=Gossypium schwendimanii TaxID=34291 RepID=A0A7J9NFS0_GOSSC|nr:hypothetical protein [Gossypium schwendimanii]
MPIWMRWMSRLHNCNHRRALPPRKCLKKVLKNYIRLYVK